MKDDLKDLKALIFESFNLERFLLQQLKDEVNYIIDNNVKDRQHIEKILDQLLNIQFVDTSEEFYNLCSYYETLDKENALTYKKIYSEYNGNDNE